MANISNKVEEYKSWWKSKTIIGTILMIAPIVVKMINPDLVLNLEAGTDEVFNQAGQIAVHVDALWAVVSQSIGIILTAVGIRTAKTTLK